MSADGFVIIGRFQTFSKAHLEMIKKAMLLCPEGLILIGSAGNCGTERDPYSFYVRERVIRSVVPRSVVIRPLQDLTTPDDITTAWGDYILKQLKLLGCNPTLMVYGNEEARSGWFKKELITWAELIIPRDPHSCSATVLREAMAVNDYNTWFNGVPQECHRLYPELRELLLQIPYYQELSERKSK